MSVPWWLLPPKESVQAQLWFYALSTLKRLVCIIECYVAIFYHMFLGENFWKVHGAHNWCHAGRDSESL